MLDKMKVVVVVVILVAVSTVGIILYSGLGAHEDEGYDIDAGLKVYGNANGDYTIDSTDLDLIKDILSGDASFDDHPLADADYDGSVTWADADLVQKILNRENCTVYHVNTRSDGDYVVDTKWPIRSAISTGAANMLLFLTMAGVEDMVHGISYSASSPPDPTLFPTFSAMSSLSDSSTKMKVDAATNTITEYNVTAFIVDKTASTIDNEQEFEKVNVDVVRVAPALVDADEACSQILLIGFLFGTETRSMEVAEWQTSLMKYIDSKLEGVTRVTAVTSNGGTAESVWISAGTSDYVDVIEAAGGIYALDEKVLTKFASGAYFNSGDTWLYNYDFDYFISIRTNDWYSGTVDINKKFDSSLQLVTNTRAYEEGHAYVVVGDGPIPIRVAYCAAVMYPEIFSMEWADGVNKEFFKNYYDVEIDFTDLFFVISPDMVSG